jgi:2-keto-4-pentenoate hydratase/2-oxohepta-3-ene-1,7-dioic acid hydratase in catechol pathway
VKLAVLNDRAVVLDNDGFVDVDEASQGRFGPDPMTCYERWSSFLAWAAGMSSAVHRALPECPTYGPPAPRPRQAFGVGVNYADHAAEAGMAVPGDPLIFAKFASSIAGQASSLLITVPAVDWEVELVVVMGLTARHVTRQDAWSVVAGLTIGQDISDRQLQLAGATPQFSLGKSRPGYSPIGPWLVTPDEFDDPDDLAISCTLNGETVQAARTSSLIHDVSSVVSYLSSVVTLMPGDVIFTGTPAGVGFTRTPPRFLASGDVLVSSIEGIGELRTEAATSGGVAS